MNRHPSVAVDAMGGDHAPDEIAEGAVRAASELGVRVLLVGDEARLTELVPRDATGVEVVHAGEVIEMHDPPSSVRAKKDASIVRCAKLVKVGAADALVSAGNTGA
ncbi:MAG: phosphate--acyl-ACP acyltransferase, partial [Acidimicrobiia bacterium]